MTDFGMESESSLRWEGAVASITLKHSEERYSAIHGLVVTYQRAINQVLIERSLTNELLCAGRTKQPLCFGGGLLVGGGTDNLKVTDGAWCLTVAIYSRLSGPVHGGVVVTEQGLMFPVQGFFIPDMGIFTGLSARGRHVFGLEPAAFSADWVASGTWNSCS